MTAKNVLLELHVLWTNYKYYKCNCSASVNEHSQYGVLEE
jgi:hypothetical protein